MSKPVIVLVPGIGDESRIYQTFANRFRKFGFAAHIIAFGWTNTQASLEPKLAAFYKNLDALGGGPLHMVGISAGGTATILAMAQRQDVQKAVVICSPLDRFPDLQNPLLAESIEQVRKELSVMTPERKRRILSVLGLYDQVVATPLSRPAGIKTKRIFGLIHAPTIFIALMFYTRSLVKFLRDPR